MLLFLAYMNFPPILFRVLFFVCLLGCNVALHAAVTVNPEAVAGLLNRIGGPGAAERFVTEVDPALSTDGADLFVLSSRGGKPLVKGNSVLSVTTGLGWYLNHHARVNLAWNNLKAPLASAKLPLPKGEERHECTAAYRYYFNYCTYSYSMAFWTWERWQQEVDWMALRGINMPLALVGADVVWKNVLLELGYTKKEVNRFVAGPGFHAWWLMNNLEGWGGENPDWWYVRQEKLAKNILAAMRAYGMTPVLPGYSGMVPSNITEKKGWAIADPGRWIAFQRPGFLVPTDKHFSEMAALYYKHLAAVMGESPYYSMDPFHEGGNTSGVDLPAAYKAIRDAMNRVNPNAKWVIQSWNENPRRECLETIERGKLVVLDLFSDGTPKWQGGYNGHEMVYCMLHNFGGRVGLHGRLATTINGYYDALDKYPATMKGVGATPEGIETNPMLYDALFELPWRNRTPAAEWLSGYCTARYGMRNAKAHAAWQGLLASVYDCRTSQQGTSEPIICARPALQVNSVSTWSTSHIYYDPQLVIRSAALMLGARDALQASPNYGYDLADIMRQAVTDYAQPLLNAIRVAYDTKDMAAFKRLKDKFLGLILDQDRLLATNANFTLGRWTQMARGVTDEVGGTTVADKEWMEWNARTQITVWGTRAAAGGLHDYSNREWAGLLRDFHYARWEKFFTALENGTAVPNRDQWFDFEHAWTKNMKLQYSACPTGQTADVAAEVFDKYFGTFTTSLDSIYYYPRLVETFANNLVDRAFRGSNYRFGSANAGKVLSLGIDFDGDGTVSSAESSSKLSLVVPVTARTGRQKAELRLADGTVLHYFVIVRDNVAKARTVTVASANETEGKVAIGGASKLTVKTRDDVTVKAIPATGYDFLHWTNAAGAVIGNANPYTYYGKEKQVFTAAFIVNKWGAPKEDLADYETVNGYEQYVKELTATVKGQEAVVIYRADACPEKLFTTVAGIVNVARGGSFTVAWSDTDKRGLRYCRLSAYIDLNADGDFDDEGELLEVRGDKDSGSNATVSRGLIRVLLPTTACEGITHLRLRFDGSYSGGWDTATGAKPAKAGTSRMVYDVPVNVTRIPAYACTVEAVSADETKGTVAISGLSNPAVVIPGDRIILQAQSKAGYKLDCWEDEHGRRVSTDANFSFIPAESGKFTARFAVDR